ncbi:MAG: restriction endonuclease, partial [Phycisphaerae bacterium]|nr:restriction endonuclease [Phycisphaerae bacterium]
MGLVGWRDRWRAKLRWKLSIEVVAAEATHLIPMCATGIRVRPERLVVETTSQWVLPEDLRLHVQYNSVLLIIGGDEPSKTLDVGFSVYARSESLLTSEAANLTVVFIPEFGAKVTWFSFALRRSEPRTLFPTTVPQPRGTRVKPVSPPPPPDSLKEADIAERLRWILTPPINELISDPELALPKLPYPFQTIGIKWLYDRESALLADEMGLGKTMQAIIAGRLLWREGLIEQILVICPKQLISNWKKEIDIWWHQASQSIMVVGRDRQFFLKLGTPNVIIKIINYESLAKETEWLKDQKFSHDLVIIDEAQRIKNPGAKQSQAVKALKGQRRWALTGTPVENKAGDIVSIFDFVHPGLLQHEDRDYLSKRIGPYMLRRRSDEVLPDLPEKSEFDIEVELSEEHSKNYRQMEEEGVLELQAKGETITVTHVFALIAKLRQICNFDPDTGKSAKLERLLEDLEEVVNSGRKALVFSQWVSMPYGLKQLAEELKEKRIGERRIGVSQLHGQVPPTQRDAVIQDFRQNSAKNVMLLNFKVGGVGLNLQAANYVFLFDRWWNPAVEDQAVKRVHRIGQAQKVFVRRFFCKDTIEERILLKLAEKRRLFSQIIDEADPQPDSLGLTEEEVFSLFNLTVRPRRTASSRRPPQVILQNMSPYDFEVLVAEVYEKQGYTVRLTGGSHDGGVDIEASKAGATSTEKIVIQCKHQKANVGRPVVQQLWGVVSSDPGITRGVLATSSGFTSEAKGFADGKRLTLIDREQICKLAEEHAVAA